MALDVLSKRNLEARILPSEKRVTKVVGELAKVNAAHDRLEESEEKMSDVILKIIKDRINVYEMYASKMIPGSLRMNNDEELCQNVNGVPDHIIALALSQHFVKYYSGDYDNRSRGSKYYIDAENFKEHLDEVRESRQIVDLINENRKNAIL